MARKPVLAMQDVSPSRSSIASSSSKSKSDKKVSFSQDVYDSAESDTEMDISYNASLAAQLWDWPLQNKDGIVRLHNNDTVFEVALQMGPFTPKEIQVKVCGNDIMIYCQHDEHLDNTGHMTRQLFRSYHLPNDIDLRTLKSHMTNKGILHITARKLFAGDP